MRKLRVLVPLVLIVVMLLATTINTTSVVAQDGDPFEGMSAEDLFPGAVNAQEAQSAYDALMAANLPDARDRFEGKTLVVAVQQAGPRGGISGPYYFWREAFETITGAKLEIVEIPSANLYTTIATDFLIDQNTYDVANIGSWYYGDFVVNGWVRDIEDFLGDPAYPQWNPEDVAEPLKALMTWEGKWYGVLNDGDAQMLYYRKDILEDPEWQAQFEAEMGYPMPVPPATWQQLLDVTGFFNGKDWNGDGDEDDGISLHLRGGGQGMFHFMTLSAPFSITPAEGDDPAQVTRYDNIYWFDPEDMTPLINQPGNVAALEFLKELAATGSDSQLGWELAEAWNNFLNGNAIATFSWGDVGSLAQDPSRSVIAGKLGGARIPCSETWYDRELGEFVTDTENPNCVGNTTGGSWHGVISARSDVQELAYYFLAMHATQPIHFWNVTYGWTGVDPAAAGDLFAPVGDATVEDYVNAGYNASDAEEYINGYGDNLFSFDISQTYLRIPGTVEYWEILDTRLAQAMTDQLEPQEALDLVAREWNDVTNSYGKDEQLAIYQTSIGYTAE